jgi:hypothetical protein
MTTKTVKVEKPSEGLLGFLHNIETDKDSILVFQLPRETKQLSENYVQGALKSLKEVLPIGRKVLVIGADVNIYSISGEEATALVLKGLI